MDAGDRVRIWNSYFQLAWEQAKALHEITHQRASPTPFDPQGGTLSPEKLRVLGTVVLCTLAIEARANHLIEELVEAGRLSEATGRAAQWLPPKEKWFLLPALAGCSAKLSADSGPHQAVAQICELRNDALHVKLERLLARLPAPGQMLSEFARFVEAMEDMNVVFKRRGRENGPLPKVISLGRFE